MVKLGISLYPEYPTLDRDRAYVILAAKCGFERILTCLSSVEEERGEVLTGFRKLIDHVHSYGMEIILDVASLASEKLYVSCDNLSFLVKMYADGIHLDEGFDPLKEALMTYNPQNLKTEVNANLGTKYLDNTMSHYPKLDNTITCHNFYPQRYSGIGCEHFEKCNQDIKDLSIKVAAFVFSQEEGIYGPWPMSEGLYTLGMYRDLSIDMQVRHLLVTRLMDDVIIVNAYASEEELSTFSKIDPGKFTFKIDLGAGLHPTEEKILYRRPHFICGDISECMARGTTPRVTYARESVPPKDTRDLKRGDVVIINGEYSHYKGELYTMLKDTPSGGRKNVTGHIPGDESMLLDYIKP